MQNLYMIITCPILENALKCIGVEQLLDSTSSLIVNDVSLLNKEAQHFYMAQYIPLLKY